MRVPRSHPTPSQMPTHGLGRVPGSLAKTSNSSSPGEGISTLQRNPCDMGQNTDFHLIKNFCSSQPLFLPLFKNLDLCSGARQWGKAAPRDGVCKGNPFLLNHGMYSVRGSSLSPRIPSLSHSCTPIVKAEGQTAGTQRSSIIGPGCYSSLTWAPTWAKERTPYENGLPIVRISPRENLTFGPSILALAVLPASHPHCLRMWAQKSSSKEFHCSPPA